MRDVNHFSGMIFLMILKGNSFQIHRLKLISGCDLEGYRANCLGFGRSVYKVWAVHGLLAPTLVISDCLLCKRMHMAKVCLSWTQLLWIFADVTWLSLSFLSTKYFANHLWWYDMMIFNLQVCFPSNLVEHPWIYIYIYTHIHTCSTCAHMYIYLYICIYCRLSCTGNRLPNPKWKNTQWPPGESKSRHHALRSAARITERLGQPKPPEHVMARLHTLGCHYGYDTLYGILFSHEPSP